MHITNDILPLLSCLSASSRLTHRHHHSRCPHHHVATAIAGAVLHHVAAAIAAAVPTIVWLQPLQPLSRHCMAAAIALSSRHCRHYHWVVVAVITRLSMLKEVRLSARMRVKKVASHVVMKAPCVFSLHLRVSSSADTRTNSNSPGSNTKCVGRGVDYSTLARAISRGCHVSVLREWHSVEDFLLA
jgi:hypothetical protein